MSDEIVEQEEVVLEDSQLFCVLTGEVKKVTENEKNLQSVIRMLNEEYGFDLDDMERDFKLEYVDPDSGKPKKQKVELAVFEIGNPHLQENIIRICIVLDEKIKDTDNKKGIAATLENAMGAVESCEFGL